MPTQAPNLAKKSRLEELYRSSVAKELVQDLSLDNIHQAPRLDKIVVSVGLGKSKEDKRSFEVAANTLLKITGQKPIETAARKSIANFKLREGQKVGMKVTLRGRNMYEFADRLFNIVLPRLRDFHGLSTGSFDSQGNFSMGLAEQSAFPELSFEETSHSHGIQVTFGIISSAKEHSRALLEKLGLPFEKEDK